LTTHLFWLVDVFFNRQSAYLWLQTVLLFSPSCSFIRMRQISYRGFSRKTKWKLARSFKFTFHYIDGVLSLNNSRFVDCVDLIYPIELEIKDTTDTHMSASYLDLYLNLETLRQKRWFQFSNCELSFIMSNFPAAYVYGVYLSQLISEFVVPIRISLLESCW
jgi:hypothetical protein